MKKLYRKGAVHPSPPIVSDQLSFLPAAILTLASALSPEDREVLAYLISFSSFSSNNTPRRKSSSASASASASGSGSGDHSAVFNCGCFRCYTNYWVRWDSSANRQVIHEIIDAFEEWLQSENRKQQGGRKDKRNKRTSKKQQPPELTRSELVVNEPPESKAVGVEGKTEEEAEAEAEAEEKGSVRRFVSFIGERIWGAASWGGGQ